MQVNRKDSMRVTEAGKVEPASSKAWTEAEKPRNAAEREIYIIHAYIRSV